MPRADSSMARGIWVGKHWASDAHVYPTSNGWHRARACRRMEPQRRADVGLLQAARGVPWDEHAVVPAGSGARTKSLPAPRLPGQSVREPDLAKDPAGAAAEGQAARAAADPASSQQEEAAAASEPTTAPDPADVGMPLGSPTVEETEKVLRSLGKRGAPWDAGGSAAERAARLRRTAPSPGAPRRRRGPGEYDGRGRGCSRRRDRRPPPSWPCPWTSPWTSACWTTPTWTTAQEVLERGARPR